MPVFLSKKDGHDDHLRAKGREELIKAKPLQDF
jgi:hypothetical protein